MKTRPSKTQIFNWKFIPITHSIIYHYQKAKKSFLVAQKSLKVLKLLRIFIDSVVFRFHNDRTLFRFFIDRILFRVLSDSVFSESSVIGSSSGSAVLLGHQCSFSTMSQFFYQIVLLLFYQKQIFCFTLYSQNEVRLMCFNHINKLRNTTCSGGWDTKYYLDNNVINFPIYICHKTPDEFLAQKQPPEVFFLKKMFLKILQYSQENTCIGVSF